MKRLVAFLISTAIVIAALGTPPLVVSAEPVMSSEINQELLSVENATIEKVTGSNKQLTVKIKEIVNASGYQVQISTVKTFNKKYTRTVNVNGNSKKNRKVVLKKTKCKGKNILLKNGKKYYLRVRGFKKSDNGTTTIKAFGQWSKVVTKKPKRYQKKVTVYYY